VTAMVLLLGAIGILLFAFLDKANKNK